MTYNYDQLSEWLDFSFSETNRELARNRLIHPLKNHPDSLAAYNVFSNGYLIFVNTLLRYLAKWIINIMYSKCEVYEEVAPPNNIIISHHTNPNFASKDNSLKDLYFGDFTKTGDRTPSSFITVFIDHTQNYTSQSLSSTQWIIGNNTSLINNIYYFYKCLKNCLHALFFWKNPTIPIRLRLAIAVEFLSPTTRKTYLIETTIDKLISNSIRQKMFLTYEGHAWERSTIQSAFLKSKKIKCIGYCHGIVLPQQRAIAMDRGEAFSPTSILTVGQTSKLSLVANGIPNDKITVIGQLNASIKQNNPAREKRPNFKKNPQKTVILFLLDGEKTEIDYGLKFLLSFVQRCPDFHIFLRLHPISINDDKLQSVIGNILKIHRNITISRNDLSLDAKQSSFSFYRGSSAVLEAVRNGSFPIFFGSTYRDIDPLRELNKLPALQLKEPDAEAFRNLLVNKNLLIRSWEEINKILPKIVSRQSSTLLLSE